MTNPLQQRKRPAPWSAERQVVRNGLVVVSQPTGPRKAQIQRGVPLPPKFKPGIAQEFPNLRAMKVDDSFVILDRPGTTTAKLANAVYAAVMVRKWGDTEWTVRKMPGGVGVWRVK